MESSDKINGIRARRCTEVPAGAKDTRVTARERAGLLEAARRRSGIEGETDLVTAGLALLAAEEDFGAWLAGQRGTLTDDFDIGL